MFCYIANPLKALLITRVLIGFLKQTNQYGRNHALGGRNSKCLVFGQAVFQASPLVPANTACYAGYNTQRKILIAQERSTVDTQLAYERTTPDLVPVVRGTMLHRGGQFSSDRRGADFSRGVHWCATKELTGLRLSSVTVVSYDLVISHTKL